ncbi:hypothetical protein ALLO2DRAFT_04413 [Frankia sp. Allo2]|nr:hypothetical protein ALLO2DRAFT_04413 [Frankia sp. Allo2]
MPTDDLFELVPKIDDLEAKLRVGRQHIQQVDVRGVGVVATSHRAEDGELGDPVASAHLGDPAVTKVDGHLAIIASRQPRPHGSDTASNEVT